MRKFGGRQTLFNEDHGEPKLASKQGVAVDVEPALNELMHQLKPWDSNTVSNFLNLENELDCLLARNNMGRRANISLSSVTTATKGMLKNPVIQETAETRVQVISKPQVVLCNPGRLGESATLPLSHPSKNCGSDSDSLKRSWRVSSGV